MNNKSIKNIKKIIQIIQTYGLIIFSVIIGAVFAYFITLSSQLATTEPDLVQTQSAKTPKIDKVIVNKLDELVDRNPNLQTTIDKSRDNPFTEETLDD